MISKIVAEEILNVLPRVLPVVVEKIITERYIRRVVQESMAPAARRPAPNTIKEIMDEDGDDPENDSPEPMQNTHKGIYHEPSIIKKESRIPTKLVTPTNPLAFLYEDLDPIPQGSVSSPEGTGDGVPLNALGGDFDKMKRLVEGMQKKDASRMSAPPAPPRVSAPSHSRTSRHASELLDGPAFPESPILLRDD